MSAPILRPYQAEAVEAIRHARERGRRRTLTALPTGTGKTVVFSRLPVALEIPPRRTLVLAHTEELLSQAAEKLRAANPDLQVGIEQAEKRAGGADVVVASVATIGRAGSRRLQELDPAEFGLIVVDEAHHATASSYKTVLDHFGAFRDGGAYTVGFTATPERGDGVGLSAIFEEVVYEKTIAEMIEAGYLAPIKAWRVRTESSLEHVRVRGVDFAESELATAVNVEGRNNLVVAAYTAHAPGRRAIVFAVNVAHAHALAEKFNASGIPAASVWGDMDRDERGATLAAFRAGDVQVVTNVGVLSEGFDDPGVSAIIMARPTKSPVFYRQAVGRGLRLAPGKADVVVIDLADTTRHALSSAAMLYGLPAEAPLDGRDLREVAEEVEREASRVQVDDRPVSVARVLRMSERVNILGAAMLTVEAATVRRVSPFVWTPLSRDRHRLELPDGERVEVVGDLLDQWRVYFFRPGEDREGGRVRFPDLVTAIHRADAIVTKLRPRAIALVSRDAAWRRTSATERQLELLRRLRVRHRPSLSKGEAGELITRAFAAGPRRRAKAA